MLTLFSLTRILVTQAQTPVELACQSLKNSNHFRLSINDFKCYFVDQDFSDKTKTFKIIPEAPLLNITSLEVRSSEITSLTSNWCNELPYIQEALITGNTIEEIQEDAFVPCIELKFIDLSFNKLTTLPPNLFVTNTRLMEIVMSNNDLVTIHPDQFKGLSKLTMLKLGYNKIRVFSFDLLRDSKKIFEFEIFKNDLYDLEVEEVTYKSAPDLERIAFESNNFHCDRYRNMKLYFEAKLSLRVKEPTAKLEKDEEPKCLDEQTWIAAVKENTNWSAELIVSKLTRNHFPGVYSAFHALEKQNAELGHDITDTKRIVDQLSYLIKQINKRLIKQESYDKDVSFYFTTIIALFCTLITLSLATCLIMYMNKRSSNWKKRCVKGESQHQKTQIRNTPKSTTSPKKVEVEPKPAEVTPKPIDIAPEA